MPNNKNPYETFRQQNARISISASKHIDDPEDVTRQEQVDRNRVVPAVAPEEGAEGQTS